MSKNNRRSSDIGAEAAFRGFRTQTLYIVNRILTYEQEDYKFQPEGEEDLSILDDDNNLKEIIQVKNYSRDLSLSTFSPKKKDSFFQRSQIHIEKAPNTLFKIVSFGEIGVELKDAINECKIKRNKIIDKMIKYNVGYKKNSLELIFNNLEIEKVNEKDLKEKIRTILQENPLVSYDVDIAFELLMYWIYDVSEKEEVITRKYLLEKLTNIGKFLTEREDFHKEFGKSFHALDYINMENSEENIMRLRDEFYIGISARYEHIKNNLDVVREEKTNLIKKQFVKNNVVIVHGASGQGKSTLAYRYLYENIPSCYAYKVLNIQDKEQARRIINALNGISNSVNLPIMLYIDVEPSNSNWINIVKELSVDFSNIKILVTIREEDWKKAEISSYELLFSDIELNLEKLEAEKIYDNLNNKTQNEMFLNFEEAWIKFNEQGPLLEFVYLITQGNTLYERLKQQIYNIEKSIVDEKDEQKLEILKLVALSDAYGGLIEIRKMLKHLNLITPKFLIESLEKEYLIQKTEDEYYLKGLHPIRSKILSEILFDELYSPKKDYAFKCFKLLNESSMEIYLLNYFFYNLDIEELLDNLNTFEFTSWNGVTGVLNSLFWLGINNFVEINIKTIDEVIEMVGASAFSGLGFDLTGQFESINILEKLGKDYKEGKEKIDTWHKTLASSRKEVFKGAIKFLKETKLPKERINNSLEISKLGEYLFWSGKLEINKKIDPDNFINKNLLQNFEIEHIGDLSLGLYYSNLPKGLEIIKDIRKIFLPKLKKSWNIPILEDDGNKIKAHYLINLFENSADTYSRIIEQLEVLRRIYPDREIFSSRTYGDELEIIPEDYRHANKVDKDIPKKNLPIFWLVKINSIFSGKIMYKYRLNSWKQYIDRAIEIRKNNLFVINKLIRGISRHFSNKKKVKILGDIVTTEEWKKVMKENQDKLLFPAVIVDKWGFNKEGQNTELLSSQMSIKKYENYRKALNDISSYLFNFLNLSKDVFQQTYNFIDNKNFKLIYEEDEIKRLIHLSFINIADLYKEIPDFQKEFKSIFKNFIDKGELIILEKEEREKIELLFQLWIEFTNPNYFRTPSIIKKASISIEKKKREIEKNILSKVENLETDETKIRMFDINDKEKLGKLIVINSKDFLIASNYPEFIFKELKDTLYNYIDKKFECLYLESKYNFFKILILVQGKILSNVIFKIRIHRLLSEKFDEPNIFDLNVDEVDENIMKNYKIKKWEDYSKEIKEINIFYVSFNKLILALNLILQFLNLEKLEANDDSQIIYQSFLDDFIDNNKLEEAPKSYIACVDICDDILENLNDEDYEYLVDLINQISSNLFLKNSSENDEISLKLDETKEWIRQLKSIQLTVNEFVNFLLYYFTLEDIKE